MAKSDPKSPTKKGIKCAKCGALAFGKHSCLTKKKGK